MGKKQKPRAAANTAQKTVPFREINENGMLRVSENRYALVFRMSNANYQLLRDKEQEEKAALYSGIFDGLPGDVHYQELFLTVDVDTDALRDTIVPPELPADTDMQQTYIRNQTACIEAAAANISDSRLYIILSYAVKNKLDNPYNILMNTFVRVREKLTELGASARPLTAEEAMELFHDLYNPYDRGSFRLPADMYAKGTNIRDYIAPAHFNFKFRAMEMGASVSRVYFVKSYSKTLTDTFVRDLLDTRYRVTIAKHIDHIEPGAAEAMLMSRLKALEGERQTRKEQNYKHGTDYIPYHLQAEIDACKETLDLLRNKEQLFEVGVYVLVSAQSPDELADVGGLLKSAALRNRVEIQELAARLEEALAAVSPVGVDPLRMNKNMLSSALSVMHPFSYRRQLEPGGYYYGINTDSRTPIIHNRKDSRNGNCFIVGQSGSGKSMFAKLEIIDTMMRCPADQILAIDPEAEFAPLAREMGGRVVDLCAGSKDRINPFDMPGAAADEDPINDKADLILSMMEAFKRAPLTAQENSIVTRCVMQAYMPYMNRGNRTQDIPTFREFNEILKNQPESEVRDLLLYLEMYIFGPVNIFAEHTNIDLSSARLIAFLLNRLGSHLKPAGMLFMLDFIWGRLLRNFAAGVGTWLYADEFQGYYRSGQGGEYFEKVFGRFRKYGGLATGLTQNISGVVESRTGLEMLQNCNMAVLLQQEKRNEETAARLYELSEGQQKFLKRPKPGEGLLVVDRVPTPFSHLYPSGNIIYRTITTKFDDKWGEQGAAQA